MCIVFHDSVHLQAVFQLDDDLFLPKNLHRPATCNSPFLCVSQGLSKPCSDLAALSLFIYLFVCYTLSLSKHSGELASIITMGVGWHTFNKLSLLLLKQHILLKWYSLFSFLFFSFITGSSSTGKAPATFKDVSATVTSNSAHLSWTVSSGTFDSFLIQYKDAEGRLRELLTEGDSREITIPDLAPSHRYTIDLYGISNQRHLGPASITFITGQLNSLRELQNFSARHVTFLPYPVAFSQG